MIDQLIIGDLASFDDFQASIADRKIKMPRKKSIKETVPFSNRTYDFSAINGETYWEERVLEYIFEITADNPEELEELKSEFAAWVMGVQEQELHDPHILDYHFLATYDDMEPEDDEGLDKTTLTVTFTAYPYKIANAPKVYEETVPEWTEAHTLRVFNKSDHPVTPTVSCDGLVSMNIGGNLYSFHGPGTWTDGKVKIPVGFSEITIGNNAAADKSVRISFYEEVR